MAIIGIYRIVSPTGKVYVGQSWNIKERWSGYKRIECTKQIGLFRSFKKYGVDKHLFEILEIHQDAVEQSELDKREQYYMDLFRSQGIKLLNCREGGSNGKLSKEAIAKMSKALKGRHAWNKGKTGIFRHTEQWKKERSLACKGKQPNNAGKFRSKSAIDKTTKANTGQVRTEEQRKRISKGCIGNTNGAGNKGKIRSEETKRKISNTLRNRYKELHDNFS